MVYIGYFFRIVEKLEDELIIQIKGARKYAVKNGIPKIFHQRLLRR